MRGGEETYSSGAGVTDVPSLDTGMVVQGGTGRGSGEGVLKAGGSVGSHHLIVEGTDNWGAKFWMASTKETLRAASACAIIVA